MADTLQDVVEALGRRLSRAVAVDDPTIKLLAYTAHTGEVDQTRLDSILQREASAASKAYIHTFGVAAASDPVVIPANPEVGMLTRICIPIRAQTLLLGYLWLIDKEQNLTPEELEVAVEAASAAGHILYRGQLLDELEESREREFVRDLLSEEQAVRERAAITVSESDLLGTSHQVVVVVGRAYPVDETTDDELRIRLATALKRTRRSLAGGKALVLARQNQAMLVAGLPRNHPDPIVIGRRLAEEMSAALEGTETRVGVGSNVDLRSVYVSYQEANRALRVAEIVPSFERVVSVKQLGVWGLIAQLPIEQLSLDTLHPGLLRLMGAEGGPPLVATLDAYLELAGDARATAEKMSIHRTSLYYRLGRIEELAGVDLASGEDRLALALGLKIARLAGVRPRPETEG